MSRGMRGLLIGGSRGGAGTRVLVVLAIVAVVYFGGQYFSGELFSNVAEVTGKDFDKEVLKETERLVMVLFYNSSFR